MLLIDGDILTYSFPFGVQEGYGEDARLVERADKVMEARIDIFINELLDKTGCEDYKIFLSSKWGEDARDNFRYKYMKDYKHGRATGKPILWQHARDYLTLQHSAVPSIETLEADDMIAMEHMQLFNSGIMPSVIASIDKDFDQLPGWHYRWEMKRRNKTIPDKKYFVTEWQGLVSLYMQALTGDKVDNIGYEIKDGKQVKCGYLRGIGEKKAKKILEECKDEKELYTSVLDIYSKALGEDAEDVLKVNMKCLYLVRGFRGNKWKTWRKP